VAIGGFSDGEAAVALGAVLLALLFPYHLGESLLLSQAILAVIIGYWLLGSLLFQRSGLEQTERTLLVLSILLAACAVAAMWTFGRSDRFVGEAIKVGLMLLGAVALSALARHRLWAFLPWAGVASAAAMVYAYRVTPDRFSYGGRLSLDDFGSPNTLGLLIALIILALILSPPGSGSLRVVRVIRWPTIGVLAWFLLQTTSRGGMFALAAGLVFGLLLGRTGEERTSKWTAGLGLVAIGAGALYVLTQAGKLGDLADRLNLGADNSSSGRTTIWADLLTRQFDSAPAIVFGFGPGSVDLAIMNKTVVSAHSLILTMFIYFGVIGLVGFVVMLAMTWRQALRIRDVHAPLRIGLLAALTLSFVVDNVVLSTQGLLPVALALAATAQLTDTRSPGREEVTGRHPGQRRRRTRAVGALPPTDGSPIRKP